MTSDLDQVQVLLQGLEAIYAPTVDASPAVVAELKAMSKKTYDKLWVPKAVLQQGSEFTLPDGIAVKVTKIVWNSTTGLHLAGHTATLHVEKV